MTAVAFAGWLCAAAAAALAVLCAERLRAQGALVARAAHELRGGICVARLALDAASPEGARLQLERAGRALADLDRAASVPDEPVDLGGLARAVAASFPGVAVRVPRESLRVRGDRSALAQACSNLVANAVEHGGAPVRVRVERRGGSAVLEVRDAGPGLPAPLAEMVRTARSRRGRRGHGLVVADEVARSHGGRLRTAPGSGVVLDLPLATGTEPG